MDSYLSRIMKTVQENPNEAKKMTPAEMIAIRMNNYEINLGKHVKKATRRNRLDRESIGN